MKHKLTIIGEYHGVQENYELYKDIVREKQSLYPRIIICLEIGHVASFLDGRLSFEFIDFLKWLKDNKVAYFGFDTFSSKEKKDHWNRRELEMVNNIRDQVNTGYVVAIMGSMHSKRSKYVLNDYKHIPCGFHLADIAEFIGIQYNSGSFYNVGVRNFSEAVIPDEQDYDILKIINKSHPVTPVFDFDTEEILKELKKTISSE